MNFRIKLLILSSVWVKFYIRFLLQTTLVTGPKIVLSFLITMKFQKLIQTYERATKFRMEYVCIK